MFGLLERWIFVRDRSTAAIRYFLLAAAVLLVALPTSAAAASGPQVSIGTVHADFYPNPSNSGSFDTSQLSSKVFSQDFPVIDFNPPASAQVTCSNSTGVDVNSRPFTDVVPDLDGTCSTVPAEAPLLQAGVGVLFTFEAVFSANLTIDAPGQVTFNFFSDDGWMLGAGQQVNGNAQPTYVSGALIGAPTSCIGQTCGTLPSPVHNYVVVGAYNQPSAPTQQQVTINFPNAGTYPIEVDYTECCGGQLALTLGTTAGNPIPPSLQFVGVATGRVVEGVAGAPTSAPTTGYRVSSTTYPLVASFTDLTPGGPPDATRYSATIDWGRPKRRRNCDANQLS